MAKTVGYMVTWTTYGTWLQGDRRGYVRDGQILREDKALHDANRGRLAQRPVRLGKENKAVVERTILSKARRIEQSILAIALMKRLCKSGFGMYKGTIHRNTNKRFDGCWLFGGRRIKATTWGCPY